MTISMMHARVRVSNLFEAFSTMTSNKCRQGHSSVQFRSFRSIEKPASKHERKWMNTIGGEKEREREKNFLGITQIPNPTLARATHYLRGAFDPFDLTFDAPGIRDAYTSLEIPCACRNRIVIPRHLSAVMCVHWQSPLIADKRKFTVLRVV